MLGCNVLSDWKGVWWLVDNLGRHNLWTRDTRHKTQVMLGARSRPTRRNKLVRILDALGAPQVWNRRIPALEGKVVVVDPKVVVVV
jgi:hypothetical protein